jgi:glycosyltransferase involved in cell wall biosynthesis
MRRADGVVFQTLEAKAWYSNSVGDASTVVIPNAVNEDFIRPRYQGERRKEIVAAGRLTDQKNFAMLLNAFSLITKKYPDYELIIYGEGPNRQTLSEQARELGISNKVYFPGYSLELGKKIEAASMFVLSSDYEGMPNVLMEAMALGLPCVSTDCPCGGPRLLIQDGINGILVPVGNAEAMAEAMDKVLSNERFSVQLGQNASKIVERLCPNKIYHEWEQFFLRVLERRK